MTALHAHSILSRVVREESPFALKMPFGLNPEITRRDAVYIIQRALKFYNYKNDDQIAPHLERGILGVTGEQKQKPEPTVVPQTGKRKFDFGL